jgi:hypothetical protein
LKKVNVVGEKDNRQRNSKASGLVAVVDENNTAGRFNQVRSEAWLNFAPRVD